MKNFVKMTLAVMCGVFIMGIIGFFLFVFGLAGTVASMGGSSENTVLPRSGVLKIDMSKFILGEQSKESNPLSGANASSSVETIGLWNAVQAINKAAADPGVQYIYLKPDGASVGIGSVQEFRQALSNFRKSGKAVISYIENPSTASYYLASVSDKVYVTSHYGWNNTFLGVSSQMYFLKDLLDKLGVNVQLIRHGKYKSAGEMFVRNSPSAENVEQTKVMVNSIWNTYAEEIAESRSVSVAKLNEMMDNLELNSPEDFVKDSLADSLMSANDMENALCSLSQVDDFSDVKMIPFPDYIKAKVPVVFSSRGQKIAVLYANGEIVDGSDYKQVSGDRFAHMISQVRSDSTIKAVVFRVNSPGGSVIASDKIKSEMDLLRKAKPVIASYGNYAASGGYWISNACDYIFSDPTTLTGSIGVFGMVPDFSKTAKNLLHVNAVSVSSNKHGDMYSLMRPFDSREFAYTQSSIEAIYKQFVSVVSSGRDLRPSFVDSIAQGRVWTGTDALKLGLVDSMGSLEDAIHYAARMASSTGDDDLTAWNVVEYPKQLTKMEIILSYFGQQTDDTVNWILMKKRPVDIFNGTPFENISKAFAGWNPETSDRFYARMPYEIIVK
ncbi:MAG: signal peptide peptidase SppA [Bacteroidales bacterium]|jgi:protease-4|nr:signal peptide peptidase SppA [Bacteroidales bacterium]MCI1785147.1 signal peptide peptidase SppA [Bacteroidales bacterium]